MEIPRTWDLWSVDVRVLDTKWSGARTSGMAPFYECVEVLAALWRACCAACSAAAAE